MCSGKWFFSYYLSASLLCIIFFYLLMFCRARSLWSSNSIPTPLLLLLLLLGCGWNQLTKHHNSLASTSFPVFFPFSIRSARLLHSTETQRERGKNYESPVCRSVRPSVWLPIYTSHQTYFIKLSEFGFFNSVLWWITSVRNGMVSFILSLVLLLLLCSLYYWKFTIALPLHCALGSSFAFALFEMGKRLC